MRMKKIGIASLVVAVGSWTMFAASSEDSANGQAFLERSQVLGEWFGGRPFLSEQGVNFFGGYTVEVWGNTTGGIKTGSVYTGLLDFGVEVDLEEAVGWKGASLSTTWLWLSGRDASEDLVGNFLTISNISGFNTLRMFELWFQQELWEGMLSIRLGQLSADSEFLISDYSGLFINGTFGWPALASMNLPNGGAAYPMGTPGIRIAGNPVDWFTFQAAVLQGDVFAPDVNRHGFRWRLDAATGYTFLSEAQIRWNQREEETGLPGQLKSGAWFQTGGSADALADSTDSGNTGFYAILDQMLYRESGEATPSVGDGKTAVSGGTKSFKTPVPIEKINQGLGWFGRVGFAPQDRNFVNFYFDTGLTYKGLLPTRDDDTLGIAFGYAQISNGARSSLEAEGSSPTGAEMVIECTYQAQITPWLTIQPDLQYIINPGGTSDHGNALVIGGRAAVTF
ncbi:MAG: carbohydrate porin [Chthoniobacterales bacterium]|nr:carbohydrate porin [Chthoniobacterales bacterium]